MNPKPFYNPNTPTPNLAFSDWQKQFLDNFTVLAEAFTQNHISLDSASNLGNHTVIELLQQDDSQQTNIGELSMYSKNVIGQTDQTFIRFQGNGTEFQFTNYQIYALKQTSSQVPFFTFLPGGLLVYFGLFIPGGKETIIKINPSVSKNIVSVSLTPSGSTGNTPPAEIIKSKDFVTGIEINLFTPAFIPNLYYTVVGNI